MTDAVTDAAPPARWMTVIADLHGRLPAVRPDSRLVLLAGDVCPDREQRAWLDGPFRAWLALLPCPCVAVPGNHDYALDVKTWDCPADLRWHFLGRTPADPYGPFWYRGEGRAGITIHANPFVLDGGACAGGEEEIEYQLRDAKPRFDVLLSHCPPLGVLDTPSRAKHIGSLALRWAIWKKRPRLCVFGHVHETRGHLRVGDTYCVNATLGAGCDHSGYPVPAPHPPWGLADDSWRPELATA